MVGSIVIVYQTILAPSTDLTIVGVAAIIAGFGPVGLAEFLKGKGS